MAMSPFPAKTGGIRKFMDMRRLDGDIPEMPVGGLTRKSIEVMFAEEGLARSGGHEKHRRRAVSVSLHVRAL